MRNDIYQNLNAIAHNTRCKHDAGEALPRYIAEVIRLESIPAVGPLINIAGNQSPFGLELFESLTRRLDLPASHICAAHPSEYAFELRAVQDTIETQIDDLTALMLTEDKDYGLTIDALIHLSEEILNIRRMLELAGRHIHKPRQAVV